MGGGPGEDQAGSVGIVLPAPFAEDERWKLFCEIHAAAGLRCALVELVDPGRRSELLWGLDSRNLC